VNAGAKNGGLFLCLLLACLVAKRGRWFAWRRTDSLAFGGQGSVLKLAAKATKTRGVRAADGALTELLKKLRFNLSFCACASSVIFLSACSAFFLSAHCLLGVGFIFIRLVVLRR